MNCGNSINRLPRNWLANWRAKRPDLRSGCTSSDRPSDRRQRRPYPKVFPKYRNPKKPAETWSGRGKQPRWLTAQLRSGKNDPPSRANIKTIVVDFVKRLWPGRNLGCLGYSRSTRYALAARGVDIRTLQCPNCADFPMRLGPRSLPT